ncbi:MAG: hypothetical protein OXF32_03590 [Anaerolineaceae bacterium]|nr:hypothetical protein [Anaerolineaceae bacterium]
MTEISTFENYICSVEELTDLCEWIVDFVRRAGQDDDTALAFDKWTGELGLLYVFEELKRVGTETLIDSSADLVEIADGWKSLARVRIVEPDLPPQLAKRVIHLDTRIRELTEEVNRQHDNDLVARLLMRIGRQRELTLDEQFRLADAVRLDWKVKEEPSVRRADWYGDD